MKKLFLLLSLVSFSSFAQELEPVINFMRSTPAYISGSIYFNKNATLYSEGGTSVVLLANKPIDFTISEDYSVVHLEQASKVQSYYMKVNVKSVEWTPRGMKSKSELAADITGLTRGKVSATVADILNDMFGAKLRRANSLLKQVRLQKTVGGTMAVAQAILDVFKQQAGGQPIALPAFRGDIGMSIIPKANKAFNLYGMRVGVKANATYRIGINFSGNVNGIIPSGVEIDGSEGIDVNTGKEFKAMARLVFKSIALNAGGTQLDMHLGASEVIATLMSVAELAARRQGYRGSCQECYELATLPPLRLMIEQKLRSAILQQVDSLRPTLQKVNVQPSLIAAFKKREACNLNGISCVQQCGKNINNVQEQKSCKVSCQSKANQCLKK